MLTRCREVVDDNKILNVDYMDYNKGINLNKYKCIRCRGVKTQIYESILLFLIRGTMSLFEANGIIGRRSSASENM